MALAETLAEGGDADFDKAAEALYYDDKFRMLTEGFELPADTAETGHRADTHDIYAALGEVGSAQARPDHVGGGPVRGGRELSLNGVYYRHLHRVRQPEARLLGGLSLAQRRHLS